MTSTTKKQILTLGSLTVVFLILTFWTGPWLISMSWLFPSLDPKLDKVIYDMAPFSQLVLEHGILVLVSSGLATILGLAAGIAVTRSWGREFLPAVSALASMGQTFPPVAVLAIAVPVVGFGFKPTIIALFLYGLLPVLRNTITGIDTVASDVLEAAYGMGMTPFQVLRRVEIPLAMPVILAGIRISTVINIGTATLGATIGAGGLGKPIIAGLIADNPAFVLEGAILVGLFAIIVDTGLGMLSVKTGSGV
ncbi:ABC transporter permease, partial [bacterium]|nr:ABC transporter permease [bacterium]